MIRAKFNCFKPLNELKTLTFPPVSWIIKHVVHRANRLTSFDSAVKI